MKKRDKKGRFKIIYKELKNKKKCSVCLKNLPIENFQFLKCQFNLGFLAKHITMNDDDKITFSDDTQNPEISDLKLKLKFVTKKYYKYKNHISLK